MNLYSFANSWYSCSPTRLPKGFPHADLPRLRHRRHRRADRQLGGSGRLRQGHRAPERWPLLRVDDVQADLRPFPRRQPARQVRATLGALRSQSGRSGLGIAE